MTSEAGGAPLTHRITQQCHINAELHVLRNWIRLPHTHIGHTHSGRRGWWLVAKG